MNNIFENSKFLHIIRDPRDCCLSRKKAWKTNIYTTATSWTRGIEIARSDGAKIKDRYKEIYYESLLKETEKTLREICGFINCEYFSQMTRLNIPWESIGDAKGEKIILKNNMNKFKNKLSKKEIKKIEEIVFCTMKNTPYNFEYAKDHIPLNKAKLRIYKKMDSSCQ